MESLNSKCLYVFSERRKEKKREEQTNSEHGAAAAAEPSANTLFHYFQGNLKIRDSHKQR